MLDRVSIANLVPGNEYILEDFNMKMAINTGYGPAARKLMNKPHRCETITPSFGNNIHVEFVPNPEDGAKYLGINTYVFPNGRNHICIHHKSLRTIYAERVVAYELSKLYELKTGQSGEPKYGPVRTILEYLAIRVKYRF